MRRTCITLLLLSSAWALAQSSGGGSKSSGTPAGSQAQAPASSGEKASGEKTSSATEAKASEVKPNDPVITIQGLCSGKTAAATGADCKTVVTREQFEKLVELVAPNVPPTARKNVAENYAQLLTLSDMAEKRGLENTPKFAEMMKLQRMQLLARELVNSVQQQAKPTAEDVQKYYDEHKAQYEEATLKRLFIPKTKPDQKPGEKPPDEATLTAEAKQARDRVAAGEDFDKVEKELYEKAGYKTPPPPTAIPTWRKDAVPPNQASVFDLKPGEISQPINEPMGIYIYKLESKKTVPLDQVKPEIENSLGTQKMRTQMEALMGTVKPDLNPAYFGANTAGAPDHTVHAMQNRNSSASTQSSTASKSPTSSKSSSTPQPK